MTQNQRPVTRVDVEEMGDGVLIKSWEYGWVEGDTPNSSVFVEGQKVLYALMDFENQGFTVEMPDNTKGRALRGDITRMDFKFISGEWRIQKYPYGWTAKTRPLMDEVMPSGWSLEKSLAWCREHGWSVHTWETGARAWKGKPLPVRDARGIKIMRYQVEAQFQKGWLETNRHLDLAYDL